MAAEHIAPEVMAVISTRNRGAAVRETVASILANGYPGFRLIVVDQNDDDATREALLPWIGRPDFQYRRSATRGLSAGRNEGIGSCSSEIVVLTDDDCEVAPDWVRSLADAFRADPRIGMVFGNVLAGDHDRNEGFIPAYRCDEALLATSILHKHRIEGIGACMALRRGVWVALDGFDESLGAGARFRSAEELDFAIRALIAGYALATAPAARVVHYGFRTWEAGRVLIAGYLYGIGATFAKQLRSGHWQIAALFWQMAARFAFGGPVVDLGHKPPHLLRLGAFLRGFGTGLISSVDTRRGHYESE